MVAAEVVRLELVGFLAALALAVGWKLVTGGIATRGLLTDRPQGGLSPTRVQLLVTTLVGAALYLGEVASSPGALPSPHPELLAIVGASNALRLGSKLWSQLWLQRRSQTHQPRVFP
jgi:hypothetical protein